MKRLLVVTSMLAIGAVGWAGSASSAGWKYGPPSDARSCQQANVPPGRIAHVRQPVWSKAGAWFMEGQWQYECRQGAPGAAYLSVWDNGVGWINVTCYLPRACHGPPPQYGIPRRPGVY